MAFRGMFKNMRIPLAVFFAVVLIGGTYWLVYGANVPQTAEASTQTALLKEIATRDSTGDGLPDWQKALYGIPLNATTTDYFNLGMTDGEAVAKGLIVPRAVADLSAAPATNQGAAEPGTLTASFAQYFMSLYLTAKQANGGVDLTQAQTNALADKAIAQLTQNNTLNTDLKTPANLKISGSGPDALRTFAAAAETVFDTYKSNATTTEMDDLQSAVMDNDTVALARISSAAQIYKNYAKGLLALPVPKELVVDDLLLINALISRANADTDLANVNADPLAALTALKQFSDTESNFWDAFSNIAGVYARAGVVLETGTPGAAFVNLIANATDTTL